MNSVLQRLIFVLVILFLVSPIAKADDWRVDDAARVVAISDVHGAYDAMVETLTNVGILDSNLAWAGGNTRLVIVGDLVDRGPRSRDVMDLLMRLEGEAISAGGYVHVLFGNHESMNMIGDLRYVSKAEYAAFAADETQALRDRWFEPWADRSRGNEDELRSRFDSTYPAGFFALREAFGADGKYGKWLLDKAVIAVINGTAFVHGGLSPLVADIGLDGVNRGLKKDLAEYVKAVDTLMRAEVILPTDNYYDHESIVDDYLPPLRAEQELLDALATVERLSLSAIFTHEGPLWYRGSVSCSEIIEGHRLNESLKAIGADRVVVGHTPTPNRQVLERFGGRVVEVDTGMLSTYYRGSGNALVIDNGELLVFNQSGGDAYTPIPHPRNVGWRPDKLSAENLQQLLETGDIVSEVHDKDSGRELVQVSDGTHTVSAIFTKRQGRGFFPDVAAYRLDRLLALDMVPVTALRAVNNKEGSLQYLPGKTGDEAQRSASGRGTSARCPLQLQWEAMYVFDMLIYNEGRAPQRMLYDTSGWNLILVEHERAFKNSKGRPRHLANVPIGISDGWRTALAELTDDVLAAQFADVLDSRRLKSLGARRDQLLAD